ncbi:MAG: hypothetical protein HY074_08490 [Deltaproteobacteria bacterium]|nr:hypothetical protein [Deltaproteobacteria bacterium]
MKIQVAAALLLIASQLGHAEEKPGPHGGKVVQNNTHQFEVKIDPAANHVEVYTLNTKKLAPRSMAITLFRDSGTGQTIELQAVNLQDPLPKFQGELSPHAGSYVGAELRFEISVKNFEILRFVPYIPSQASRL